MRNQVAQHRVRFKSRTLEDPSNGGGVGGVTDWLPSKPLYTHLCSQARCSLGAGEGLGGKVDLSVARELPWKRLPC